MTYEEIKAGPDISGFENERIDWCITAIKEITEGLVKSFAAINNLSKSLQELLAIRNKDAESLASLARECGFDVAREVVHGEFIKGAENDK